MAKAGKDLRTFTRKVKKEAKAETDSMGGAMHSKRRPDAARSIAGASPTADEHPGTVQAGDGRTAGGVGALPGGPASVITYSGSLSIWHGRFGRWRQRCFAVDAGSGALVYHAEDAKAQQGYAGAISLHRVAVKRENATGRRFKVATEVGTYHFKASKRSAADAWVEALRAAVATNLEQRLAKERVQRTRSMVTPTLGRVDELGDAGGLGDTEAGTGAEATVAGVDRRQFLQKLVADRVASHMKEGGHAFVGAGGRKCSPESTARPGAPAHPAIHLVSHLASSHLGRKLTRCDAR